MAYAFLIFLCLMMLSHRARLILLPASLFFTFNPIQIDSLQLGIGTEAVGLIGCVIAILSRLKIRLSEPIQRIFWGLIVLGFVVVVLRVSTGNYRKFSSFFMDNGRLPKIFLTPLLYLWAFSLDIVTEEDGKVFLWSFLFSGAVAATHGILQYILVILEGGQPPAWAVIGVNKYDSMIRNIELGRAFGPTPHTAVFARDMAFLFLMVIWVRTYDNLKFNWATYIISPLALVALLMTNSFAGFLMVILGVGLYVLGRKVSLKVPY